MSIILHKGDIRSYLSDGATALPVPCVCWLGSSMSPFYADGDLAGTPGSFSPSVRRMRCSQAGQAVRRQDTAVRRHAPRLIRIMRAQKSVPFPGRTLDVLAPLHIEQQVIFSHCRQLHSLSGGGVGVGVGVGCPAIMISATLSLVPPAGGCGFATTDEDTNNANAKRPTSVFMHSFFRTKVTELAHSSGGTPHLILSLYINTE
jgi:hypothetical protein